MLVFNTANRIERSLLLVLLPTMLLSCEGIPKKTDDWGEAHNPRNDFRVHSAQVRILKKEVNAGESVFFYFTWAADNPQKVPISYSTQIWVTDMLDINDQGDSSARVFSRPKGATGAWNRPGIKVVRGETTFRFPDGSTTTVKAIDWLVVKEN